MEKLFRDMGVNLPCDIFNTVWDEACQRDGTDDKASVEMFRQTLEERFQNGIEMIDSPRK